MITRKDPVELAPDKYKVMFENDKVRCVELTLHPGESIEMHDHPDMLAYPFTDIENVWTYPDGSEEDVSVKKGEVLWHDAFSHGAENTGSEDMKVLVIELKK